MYMQLHHVCEPDECPRYYDKDYLINKRPHLSRIKRSPRIRKVTKAKKATKPQRNFKPIKFAALALEISKREHGKKQVDIAQISEVLKNVLNILGEEWSVNQARVEQLFRRRFAKSKRSK